MKENLYVFSKVDSKEKKPLDRRLIQIKLMIIFEVKFRFSVDKSEFIVDRYGCSKRGKYWVMILKIDIVIINVGAIDSIIK